jgi:hypothetical protein
MKKQLIAALLLAGASQAYADITDQPPGDPADLSQTVISGGNVDIVDATPDPGAGDTPPDIAVDPGADGGAGDLPPDASADPGTDGGAGDPPTDASADPGTDGNIGDPSTDPTADPGTGSTDGSGLVFTTGVADPQPDPLSDSWTLLPGEICACFTMYAMPPATMEFNMAAPDTSAEAIPMAALSNAPVPLALSRTISPLQSTDSSVPEPSSVALMGLGLAALRLGRRRPS